MGRVGGGVEEKDGSEEFFAGFKGFEDIIFFAFGPLESHYSRRTVILQLQERNQPSYNLS